MPKPKVSADALPHRMFIRIAEIGWLNQDGKNRLSVTYKGKSVAHVDKPLALAQEALRLILEEACWTTQKAMEQDIAEFKDGVAKMLQDAERC